MLFFIEKEEEEKKIQEEKRAGYDKGGAGECDHDQLVTPDILLNQYYITK